MKLDRQGKRKRKSKREMKKKKNYSELSEI